MTFNLADLFECAVDAVPDRTAMVTDTGGCTYAAARRAGQPPGQPPGRGRRRRGRPRRARCSSTAPSTSKGCWPRSRCGPCRSTSTTATSRTSCATSSTTPIWSALIFHRQFGERVAAVAAELPRAAHLPRRRRGRRPRPATVPPGPVPLRGGTGRGLARAARAAGRSGDDIYIAYTGGTTGMPKGRDVAPRGHLLRQPWAAATRCRWATSSRSVEELAERASPRTGMVALPTPPFMHVSAHWMVFSTLYGGGTVVLPPGGRFDPAAIWELVDGGEGQHAGDRRRRHGRPLLDARRRSPPGTLRRVVAFVIGSGGAILSPTHQGPDRRGAPQRHRRRRVRRVGDRRRRDKGRRRGRRRRRPALHGQRPDRGARRRAAAGRARARTPSAGWPAAATSRSATTATRPRRRRRSSRSTACAGCFPATWPRSRPTAR